MDKARFRVSRYDSAQSHAELASTCRNYARSGLPERNMQSQSMEFACRHWEIAVQKESQNMDYQMRLAEVYCESGFFSEALEIYRRTVEFPEFELESSLGICRVYFDQRDYPTLYRQVQEMSSKPTPRSYDPFKLGVYNFWISYFKVNEDEEWDDAHGSLNADGVLL